MAKGDLLDGGEEIIRAFFVPYWDEVNKRATPSAFLDKNGVSVSRLAVLDYENIVKIYRTNFDGQILQSGQTRHVRQTGRLVVKQVYALCDAKIDSNPPQDPPSVCARVVEDPTEERPPRLSNPAHALIQGWDRATTHEPMKFSRTVAKRLLDACYLEDVS
jgi:hypothetical protein